MLKKDNFLPVENTTFQESGIHTCDDQLSLFIVQEVNTLWCFCYLYVDLKGL